ncbi:MAG: hypothetical protein AB7G06_06915 [Bdellovibrionales bacterium]
MTNIVETFKQVAREVIQKLADLRPAIQVAIDRVLGVAARPAAAVAVTAHFGPGLGGGGGGARRRRRT